MILICLICFGVLILGLSVLYALFGEKDAKQGLIISSLLILSVTAFCLTLLNVTTFSSAVAIFFPLSIVSFGLGEVVNYSSLLTKNQKVVGELFRDIGIALFTVGIIVLGEFNFVGLLCGELAGLCLGLLFWALKKTQNKLEIATSVIGYMICGMSIGCGVWNVICQTHLISSILSLSAGVMILAFMILKTFWDEDAKVRFACKILLPLALAVMSLSVYFF